MSKKDFSEIINDFDSLTLGQLFRIIAKIKYRVLVSIFLVAFSALSTAFVAGRYYQQQDVAVLLHSPFSMRVTIANQNYDFNNLTLIEDPTMSDATENRITLLLREIQNEFDVVPVGKVIAKSEKRGLDEIFNLIFADSNVFVSNAYAKTSYFDWNKHLGDFDFKEQHADTDTVHRYYADGCILEYKVDENRKSIRSTFKWIKQTH